MGDTLWDLYREAGLAPSPAVRAAREGAPPPLPQRRPLPPAIQAQRDRRARLRTETAPHVARSQAFASRGNQFEELPHIVSEATGGPSLARAYQEYQGLARGTPGYEWNAANENAIWGGLGAFGMVDMATGLARGMPRPPPRPIANDGNVFPRRLPEELTPPQPGFFRPGFYPEELWNGSNGIGVNRSRYQAMLSTDPPIPYSDAGGPWQAIEERFLAEMTPEERASFAWEDNPRPPPTGSSNVRLPQLGTPDISADPMVARRPPGMPPSRPPSMLRAPARIEALDAGHAGGETTRFRFEGAQENGARAYSIPAGDGYTADMRVSPDGDVIWGFMSADGRQARSLPANERASLGLRAMRGVIEALEHDAAQFGAARYNFGADTAHQSLYRNLGRVAREHGFELVEPEAGAFELTRTPTNAPDGGQALARLRAEGFDTETPLYRGHQGAPSTGHWRTSEGMQGEGVYLTHDPAQANKWALRQGDNSPTVHAVYVRGPIAEGMTFEEARAQGYRGLRYRGAQGYDETVIFDPADVSPSQANRAANAPNGSPARPPPQAKSFRPPPKPPQGAFLLEHAKQWQETAAATPRA